MIPVTVLIIIVLSIVFENPSTYTSISHPQVNSKLNDTSFSKSVTSNNLYSGPFAILDGVYGIDDTLFFIGSGIPSDSKGEIIFIRPDGKIHHTIQFDGSKSAVNHYFTPVSSSDLKNCLKCAFFGTWKISFKTEQGIAYTPIYFKVTNSTH
jgi:hypothetical protein